MTLAKVSRRFLRGAFFYIIKINLLASLIKVKGGRCIPINLVSKNKIVGAVCYGVETPNSIQPREYSRGGGIDNISHEITLGRERKLELRQRWLERQCELRRESEQVERWQSGGLSLLFCFSSLFERSFIEDASFPTAQFSADTLEFF